MMPIPTETLFSDSKQTLSIPGRKGTHFLSGFQSIPPRYISTQSHLIEWLIDAHVRAGGLDRPTTEALFSRYAASMDHISSRGHELEDFTHRNFQKMRLFGPQGSDLTEKTAFFAERTNVILEQFYPNGAAAPDAIVHVTCTGYTSPSAAQRVVSTRGWGRQTQVTHAYHMGCYAAHPAIRIAIAHGSSGRPVDVVHTELCSLHLDPASHDPAHLVIQSLFADGFIRYQVRPRESLSGVAGLEILAMRDEIVPDSLGAMAWAMGPLHFTMELSKDVPVLLAASLPRFLKSLFEEAGLEWEKERVTLIAAVHPGGPRIIDLAQRILGLGAAQVRHSRDVLRAHGNMSSATLPHIWQQILRDETVPNGTIVASIGAGPGLTLSGMVFRKRD